MLSVHSKPDLVERTSLWSCDGPPRHAREAMRLGRVLASIAPDHPEVHGLVALMELQASRARARTDADDSPVLLLDQNRGLWDQILVHRGLAALDTAERLGGALGPYALQAAIAACHARARTAEDTDWGPIAALCDALSQVAPSPVVEVNRAMALAMAFGPEAGLALADELTAVPELDKYYPLPSVRGDLLAKLGRNAEAHEEFVRAASLTRNTREQAVLLARAAECAAAADETCRGTSGAPVDSAPPGTEDALASALTVAAGSRSG